MHQTFYQTLLLHHINFLDMALYSSGVWDQQIVETKWNVYKQILEAFYEYRCSKKLHKIQGETPMLALLS